MSYVPFCRQPLDEKEACREAERDLTIIKNFQSCFYGSNPVLLPRRGGASLFHITLSLMNC